VDEAVVLLGRRWAVEAAASQNLGPEVGSPRRGHGQDSVNGRERRRVEGAAGLVEGNKFRHVAGAQCEGNKCEVVIVARQRERAQNLLAQWHPEGFAVRGADGGSEELEKFVIEYDKSFRLEGRTEHGVC
jgi:hypothetical protein